MMLKLKKLTCFLLLAAAVTLTGCGGGGGSNNPGTGSGSGSGSNVITPGGTPTYTGSTTAASIDTINAEEIATTTTESLSEIISSTTANNANPFAISMTSGQSPLSEQIVNIIYGVVQNATLPVGITLGNTDLMSLVPGYCGGTITVPDDFVGSTSSFSGSMTFNDLCLDEGNGQVTVSGTVTFVGDTTSITITYTDFSVSTGGVTEIVNVAFSCAGIDTPSPTCSLSTIYFGSDGQTFQVSNFVITTDASNSYVIGGTFFHPAHGSVDFLTITPVTFNCPAGQAQPDSGELTFTGSGSTSGRIVFDSCTSYTWCFDEGAGETCNTGTW